MLAGCSLLGSIPAIIGFWTTVYSVDCRIFGLGLGWGDVALVGAADWAWAMKLSMIMSLLMVAGILWLESKCKWKKAMRSLQGIALSCALDGMAEEEVRPGPLAP